MRINKSNLTAVASAISLALSTSVLAQDDAASNDDTSGIERIEVTSQKRLQSVQEIGIALSAFNGDELRDQGINSPMDIDKVVPNVDLSNVGGAGMPILVMRGIGLQNFRINDSPTNSFYIDEVYQASIATAEFSMYDLERLEVLKGPQGGLYGRNAVGGAIQIISAKPDVDAGNTGFVDLGYGEFSKMTGEFGVNIPMSDNTAARFSGRVEQSDDQEYFNGLSGQKHGEKDKWGVRLQVLHEFGSDSDVLFKVHAGSDQSEGVLTRALGIYNNIGNGAGFGFPNISMGLLTGLFGAGEAALCDSVRQGNGADTSTCATLTGITPDDYGMGDSNYSSAQLNELQRIDNQWIGASIIFNTELDGGITFTSITAYDQFDYARYNDPDATPVEFQDIDYISDVSFWSQELLLISAPDPVFNWILGASYSEDELQEDSVFYGKDGVLPLAFAALGGPTGTTQDYKQESSGFSVYGQSDYKVGEKTTLIGELRYTDEERTFVGGAVLDFADGSSSPFIYADDAIDFSAVTGKIGVNYQAKPTVMYYANISKGFKTGGFYGGFAISNDELAPYEEETILAYEAGFKSDLLDNTLRVNGSVFVYDRQDVQQNASNPNPTDGISIARLTNVGDVETYGAELDTTWAATDNLLLQLALGYTDAEISDSDYVANRKIPFTGSVNLEGTNIPNYSKFSSNFIASHLHEINETYEGVVQFEWSYRSEKDLSMVTNDIDAGVFKEPGYHLMNLRYTIENLDDGWKVSAFVDNLADEEYRVRSNYDGLYGVREYYGIGRTWGVKFNYNW